MDYGNLLVTIVAPALAAIALALWIIALGSRANARQHVKRLEANNADLLGRYNRRNAEYYELAMRQGPAFDEEDREILEAPLEWFTKNADVSDFAGALNITGDWTGEPVVVIEFDDAVVTLRATVEHFEPEYEDDLDEEAEETAEVEAGV